MKSAITVTLTCAAIAVSTFAIVAFAGSSNESKSAAPDRNTRIERGRYIVHAVGLCIDCHSPRNERGEFLEGKELTGSVLAFAPTVPMPAWAGAAPRIAGIPAGYTEKELVRFLMTGERPHGQPAVRPPMPPYRMSREDAEDVVDYVSTLPAGTP